MDKLALASPALRTALLAAGGLGAAALENKYIVPDLDPGLKKVNLGIGALTGGLLRNPKARMYALGSLPFKQLGLFGISAADKLRQQQQSLVDANLNVAKINRQAALVDLGNKASQKWLMALGLIPAIAGGAGLGYLGYSQYKKDNKPKKPSTRRQSTTLNERGRYRPGKKVRIDVPAESLPEEFFQSLINADDAHNSRTRLMASLTPEERQRLIQSVPAEAKAASIKLAATSQMSVPGMLRDIAYESTLLPGIGRTARDFGQSAYRGFSDEPGMGRSLVGGIGNAAMTGLTAGAITAPTLGWMAGPQYVGHMSGKVPTPGYAAPSRFQQAFWSRIRPWTGAGAQAFRNSLNTRFKFNPYNAATQAKRGLLNPFGWANRAINLPRWGMALARRHPLLSLAAIGIPASMATEKGASADARMPVWKRQLPYSLRNMRNMPNIPLSSIIGDLFTFFGSNPRHSVRNQVQGAVLDRPFSG